MINEEQVYKEFEKALEEALTLYKGQVVSSNEITIFIEDRVWESTLKYNRMINVTKEKFFEDLKNNVPVEEYAKRIQELWDIDHSYMDKSIEELKKMVMQKDIYDAETYGKVTTRSIKLENKWKKFKLTDEDYYPLNPERDFRMLEQRYVNRNIKLYENISNRYKNSVDIERDLANFVPQYEKLSKTIPYFSHTTGEIISYQTLTTYLNMLYNVNLVRSAWNRTNFDSKLLGNNLFYLPAHPYACPHCMEYQGFVYTDEVTKENEKVLNKYGKPGAYLKEDAIDGGVGHPNCKHNWLLYWSPTQIQKEKYNSAIWEEKYETKQKIQSLDLEKSRLLANRRIYKELGQQDLVDRTTERIKKIREKKKELE